MSTQTPNQKFLDLTPQPDILIVLIPSNVWQSVKLDNQQCQFKLGVTNKGKSGFSKKGDPTS